MKRMKEMKVIRYAAPALLAALLLCAGCRGEGSGADARQYDVYYAAAHGRSDGSAVDCESRSLPPGTGAIEGLLDLLLAGPQREDLVSPFPEDVSLLGWRLEEGMAVVDLSEAYGGLTGVDMSLADGCVVLTLSQVDGVESVYITVEGRARPFRDKVLRAEELLLENGVRQTADEE